MKEINSSIISNIYLIITFYFALKIYKIKFNNN